MIWRAKSKEWRVSAFAKCPECGRLLRPQAGRCPECGAEINEEYAVLTAIITAIITQACGFANTIKYSDLGAVIVICASVYAYFLGAPGLFALTPLMSLTPLLTILWWFYRFGRLKYDDEDFARAKRDMRASLKLWLTLFVVQLIAVAAAWR